MFICPLIHPSVSWCTQNLDTPTSRRYVLCLQLTGVLGYFTLPCQEDAVLVEKRSFLLMRQQRLKAALGKIESFAPDVLAVSK